MATKTKLIAIGECFPVVVTGIVYALLHHTEDQGSSYAESMLLMENVSKWLDNTLGNDFVLSTDPTIARWYLGAAGGPNLPDTIYFKSIEDVLAFKLAWGLHDIIVCDTSCQ